LKILLIHPRLIDSINKESETVIENIGFVPPLGIAYIASSLENNGHQVSILDCEALELSPAEIKNRIETLKPEVVGVSALTTNIRGALESAEIAKEAGSIVIMGGPHLMVFPQETLSYRFIDYGIRGEGEIAMVELLHCIEREQPLGKIPGAVFRVNGQIVVNEPAQVDDIDAVPIPAYHLLPSHKYEISNFGGKTLSMFTTRGCPYNCGFCYRNPLLYKVRKRDPAKVVDEIEYVLKKFKINHINFVDEVITFDKKHISAVCEEILTRNLAIRWQAATRVDTVDYKLLELMHRAGCHTLRFGVESGNQEIINLMNKKTTLRQAAENLRLCKKVGIKTVAYFIIGYLSETDQTVSDTIAFAKDLSPDYAIFGPAYPLPETKLFNDAVKEGLVEPEYWREFVLGKRTDAVPFLFPDTRGWVARAYRSFYFRPGYILKRFCEIDSWKNLAKNCKTALSLLQLKTN